MGGVVLGTHYISAAILEVINGHLNDAIGIFHGMVFIKLDMDHIILFHLGNGMRGDELGMEALGNVGQVLEDTLHVYDHRITGTGDNCQFLLQKGSGRRYTVALQNLVGSTADSCKLDTFGPF
jgi:hypothetical protein